MTLGVTLINKYGMLRKQCSKFELSVVDTYENIKLCYKKCNKKEEVWSVVENESANTFPFKSSETVHVNLFLMAVTMSIFLLGVTLIAFLLFALVYEKSLKFDWNWCIWVLFFPFYIAFCLTFQTSQPLFYLSCRSMELEQRIISFKYYQFIIMLFL